MNYQQTTHCPNCFKPSSNTICPHCHFNKADYLQHNHHLPLSGLSGDCGRGEAGGFAGAE